MSDKDSSTVEQALETLTAGIDDVLATLKRRQTTALCSLTKCKNSIVALMQNDNNLHQVKTELDNYDQLFLSYQDAHDSLCQAIPEEVNKDSEVQRFNMHENAVIQFRASVQRWIGDAENRLSDQLDRRSVRSRSSRQSRSTTSTKRSRTHEKAKLAALLIERERTEAQQELACKKQALETEEKKFQLDLEIEKTRAREKIYAETSDNDENDIQTNDMNKYFDTIVNVSQSVSQVTNQDVNVSNNTAVSNNVTVDQSLAMSNNVNVTSPVSVTKNVSAASQWLFPHLPSPAPPIMSSRVASAPAPAVLLSMTQSSSPAMTMVPPPRQSVMQRTEVLAGTAARTTTSTAQQQSAPSANKISVPLMTQQSFQQMPIPSYSQPAIPSTTHQVIQTAPAQVPSYHTPQPTLPSNHFPLLDPMQQLIAAMTLPQPEVPKFSDDPMEFSTFMMAFTSRIKSRVFSASDRLYYLNQHLADEAKNIISGCLHIKPFYNVSTAIPLRYQQFTPIKSCPGQPRRLIQYLPY